MQVLGVGVATLDIIDRVAEYPREDTEQRALSRCSRVGGNTANTLLVLSQLGHSCSWAGTLAGDPAADQIAAALQARAIDIRWVRRHAGGSSPVSHVLLSRRTASRTIVHYRELPEFAAEDFARIDLSSYDWIHFEGRSTAACEAMLRRVRGRRPGLRISLEVEKPRPGIEELFPLADVLIFSRAYARAKGHGSAAELLASARVHRAPGLLYAAWGEQGAWLEQGDGIPLHCPPQAPVRVVDTLGAGDVFNAGLIHALSGGEEPRRALTLAVELAGRKCGREGFDGLVE